MACECTKTMLEKVDESIRKTLPSNVVDGSYESQWQNKVYRLDGGKNDVMLGVNIEYQQSKKDGTHYKNKSKKHIHVAMTFCPFCGEKYEEVDKAA